MISFEKKEKLKKIKKKIEISKTLNVLNTFQGFSIPLAF
jgi:hypothetical protein